MGLARSILHRPKVVIRRLVAPDPEVPRLSTHSEHSAQLRDVAAPTLRCIPAPLPLQDEFAPLIHGICPLPGHSRVSGMLVGNSLPRSGMLVGRSVGTVSRQYPRRTSARSALLSRQSAFTAVIIVHGAATARGSPARASA